MDRSRVCAECYDAEGETYENRDFDHEEAMRLDFYDEGGDGRCDHYGSLE